MNRASFNGNKLLACRLLIFWLIQSAYFSSLFIYPLLEGVAAAHGHRPAVADAAQPHRRRHLPPVQRFHHRVRFLRPLGQALGLQRLLTVDQGFFLNGVFFSRSSARFATVATSDVALRRWRTTKV